MIRMNECFSCTRPSVCLSNRYDHRCHCHCRCLLLLSISSFSRNYKLHFQPTGLPIIEYGLAGLVGRLTTKIIHFLQSSCIAGAKTFLHLVNYSIYLRRLRIWTILFRIVLTIQTVIDVHFQCQHRQALRQCEAQCDHRHKIDDIRRRIRIRYDGWQCHREMMVDRIYSQIIDIREQCEYQHRKMPTIGFHRRNIRHHRHSSKLHIRFICVV